MKKQSVLSQDPADITWEMAWTVWWSLYWRWLIWGTGVGVLASMLVTILLSLAGNGSAARWYAPLSGFLAGSGMGALAVWQVLRLSDFREFKVLVFTKRRASSPEDFAPLRLDS